MEPKEPLLEDCREDCNSQSDGLCNCVELDTIDDADMADVAAEMRYDLERGN